MEIKEIPANAIYISTPFKCSINFIPYNAQSISDKPVGMVLALNEPISNRVKSLDKSRGLFCNIKQKTAYKNKEMKARISIIINR